MCTRPKPPDENADLRDRVSRLEEQLNEKDRSPKQALLTACILIVVSKTISFILGHANNIVMFFNNPHK